MNAVRASNPTLESQPMQYVQIEGGTMTGKIMHTVGECNLCGKERLSEFVDGKTRMGPWANMCLPCYRKVGVGLGQRYAVLTPESGSLSLKTQAAQAHTKAKADLFI